MDDGGDLYDIWCEGLPSSEGESTNDDDQDEYMEWGEGLDWGEEESEDGKSSRGEKKILF